MRERDPLYRLVEARRRSGRSLRSVGREIGLPYQCLFEAERGQRALPRKYWAALAEAIGVTVDFVAETCVLSGPVTIDLRTADDNVRCRVASLLAAEAAVERA